MDCAGLGRVSRPAIGSVDASASARALPPASQIGAVVAGNALEFYDFLSFVFFSVNLARVMFPRGEPGSALLLTLMTGSLGFFARPAGALVFGLLGDRLGRRPTMLATFALMGTAALGLALTPDYRQIGLAAPVLVVVFRLLQGLAVGGDVGPTTAFLAEASAPERRGLIACLQLAAMRLGAMGGGIAGLVLAWSLNPAQLDAFGWRIAFGAGAVIVPVVFVLRRRLDETLHQPERDPHPVTALRPAAYGMSLLGVFAALLMAGVADYLYTFAVTFLHTPARLAYVVTIMVTATQVAGAVVGGLLADRFGRRIVKLVPWIAGAVVCLPLYGWMAQGASFSRLVIVGVIVIALTATGQSAAFAAMVDLTPKRARSGLIGVGYGLVVAAAFGLGPPLLQAFVAHTHDLAGPGYVFLIGFVLGLVSAVFTPETHPLRREVGASRPVATA